VEQLTQKELSSCIISEDDGRLSCKVIVSEKYKLFKLKKRCKNVFRGVWFLTFPPSQICFGKMCSVQSLLFGLCSFQEKKV
jgi:hypothetical protein